jgi:hypothetical protein
MNELPGRAITIEKPFLGSNFVSYQFQMGIFSAILKNMCFVKQLSLYDKVKRMLKMKGSLDFETIVKFK